MATKALEIKRRLKVICEELPAVIAAKAQVSHGHPNGDPERRSVQILKVEWEESQWKTNRSREERLACNVRFLAYVLGGTALDAEEAAIALSDGFEDYIKNNPTLGITGVLNSDCVPREFDSAPATDGWVAGIDYEVRVTARI